MKKEIKDLSAAIDDAEHLSFLCPLCDQPMYENEPVEICLAWGHHVLVHGPCAYDSQNEREKWG